MQSKEIMTAYTKKKIAILCFIIFWGILLYLPGLKGGFLFDDLPNLGDMTAYGDARLWESGKQYIVNGFAGPTGRPISLATFWLTASSWVEGNAFPFKLINLILHLGCGVLLFSVIQYILKLYQYEEKKALFIAFFASSLWLVHPLFVSTTLYVVQRMTQLALFFNLLGILGYLYGRLQLEKDQYKAYIIMTLSVGLGTLIATFSKENGALLPLFILVIEFCNPAQIKKTHWVWRSIVLVIPSILVLWLILKEFNFSDHPWPSRNFNQPERLMSEARIVSEYLFRIYVPQIEGQGLYQDGYVVSKSLFQPITTLYSIIFLLVLLITALVFRFKYPLYALSILFFFAAHLMESTLLGLELYFEHRNYAAAIFIFLPLGALLWGLRDCIQSKIITLIALVIVVFFSIFTFQRAILWGDTQNLKNYWAQHNPNSPRAQIGYAQYLINLGHTEQAMALIEKTMVNRPDSPLLTVRYLRQKLAINELETQDINWMRGIILTQRPEGQTITDLSFFVDQMIAHGHLDKSTIVAMIEVLHEMRVNQKSTWKLANWPSVFLYLEGRLYLSIGQYDHANETFIDSLKHDKNFEKALAMTIEFTHYDQHRMAYRFLNQIKEDYDEQLAKDARQKLLFDDLKAKLEKDLGL